MNRTGLGEIRLAVERAARELPPPVVAHIDADRHPRRRPPPSRAAAHKCSVPAGARCRTPHSCLHHHHLRGPTCRVAAHRRRVTPLAPSLIRVRSGCAAAADAKGPGPLPSRAPSASRVTLPCGIVVCVLVCARNVAAVGEANFNSTSTRPCSDRAQTAFLNSLRGGPGSMLQAVFRTPAAAAAASRLACARSTL